MIPVTGRGRLHLVDAAALAPYVEGLRRLEASITYPIAGGKDAFTIDHGPAYHPFFSALGEAWFVVATGPSDDDVRGVFTGILRHARVGARVVRTGYACDLKVAPAHRGTALAKRILAFAFAASLTRPALRGAELFFGAAMQGARGDVTRSVKGLHVGKLARPLARLAIYFVAPAQLAALGPGSPPSPPDDAGYDLSPIDPADPPIVSTAGRKDLRLVSTGEPWPLAHLVLGPARWTPDLGAYLRACGARLVDAGAPALACFAIDERLAAHVTWLRREGVLPGAGCVVYALRWPRLRGWPRPAWVHLATSEI